MQRATLPYAPVASTSARLVVCAIDPGPLTSALCVWDGARILYRAQMSNADVRDYIRSAVGMTIVIEQIASYGMAVGASTFQTCYESGRFVECAAIAGLPCRMIPRLEVKQHICHDSRAKDSNIAAALVDRFGNREAHGQHGKGTKRAPGFFYGFASHDWAAFALAVTAREGAHSKATDAELRGSMSFACPSETQ